MTLGISSRRYIAVLGGFLIRMVHSTKVLGTLYITGNISIYIASHLRIYDSSITLEEINILLPIQVVSSTFTIYFGSCLCTRYNAYV